MNQDHAVANAAADGRSSQPVSPDPMVGVQTYAQDWEANAAMFRDWLTNKRFAGRPDEAAAVFQEAVATLRAHDWALLRAEEGKAEPNGASRAAGKVVSLGDVRHRKDEARKRLGAIFSRIVRAIEIRHWTQLILELEHIPVGPLSLAAKWQQQLPPHYRTDLTGASLDIQVALGELARGGWSALGGYGVPKCPAAWFIEQLTLLLESRRKSWKALLFGEYSNGKAEVAATDSMYFQLQRMAELRCKGASRGEAAFGWAISKLCEADFSRLPDIDTVSNPGGYLRTSFASLIEDYFQAVDKPGLIQKPRPEQWMRTMGEVWIRAWRLVRLERRSTAAVVQALLDASAAPGSTRAAEDIDDDPGSPNSAAETAQATESARTQRMVEWAREVETRFPESPALRCRAIAIAMRAFVELKGDPDAPMVGLTVPGAMAEDERERVLPVQGREPLAEWQHREHQPASEKLIHAWRGLLDQGPKSIGALLGDQAAFQLNDEEWLLLNLLGRQGMSTSAVARHLGLPDHLVRRKQKDLMKRLGVALRAAGFDATMLDPDHHE